MPHKVHLTSLIDAAANTRLAVIYYRKGVTGKRCPPRLVEPYSFAEGKQDVLIRCFQLEQDGNAELSGWRFFMAHKLHAVEVTNLPFRPRRKVVLPTGEVKSFATPEPAWNHEGRLLYRDYVGDAIADGELDPGEIFDLEGLKQKHKLTEADIRFVHASIYHRCLGSVLDDAQFSDEEVQEIRFLHRAMRSLGWAVGD